MPPSSCVSASAFQQEELGLFDLTVIWMKEVFVKAGSVSHLGFVTCVCVLSDAIALAY